VADTWACRNRVALSAPKVSTVRTSTGRLGRSWLRETLLDSRSGGGEPCFAGRRQPSTEFYAIPAPGLASPTDPASSRLSMANAVVYPHT
jgi:hypothetical protein